MLRGGDYITLNFDKTISRSIADDKKIKEKQSKQMEHSLSAPSICIDKKDIESRRRFNIYRQNCLLAAELIGDDPKITSAVNLDLALVTICELNLLDPEEHVPLIKELLVNYLRDVKSNPKGEIP